MNRLVARAHGDESLDALGTRLRLLRCLDAIEDGVPIRTVDGVEERLGALVLVEGFGEVVRHGRRLRAVVGALPSSITLGTLDLGEPRRFHTSASDESLGLRAVDLRPRAP